MYNVEKILNIVEKFFQEAQKCYENKCYIASLILYGATLEALLLSMCFAYPEKVKKTGAYKKKEPRGGGRREKEIFLEFTLGELIQVAEELEWLPMKERVEDLGKFKNWVKWLHMTRNLIHPALWLKPDSYFGNINKVMEQASKEEYKKFVKLSEEIILGIKEILLGKVMKDLSSQIKTEKTRGSNTNENSD